MKLSCLFLFFLQLSGSLKAMDFAKDTVIPEVSCMGDIPAHYALYLPPAYDPKQSWPVVYCFDPAGMGDRPVEIFKSAAREFGFILVGSLDSKNGPLAENVPKIKAMVEDTLKRFSIDKRRLYSAGFSGGAEVALMFEVINGYLPAGVIANSNTLPDWFPPEKLSRQIPIMAYAGSLDFNHWVTRDLYDFCCQRGQTCRLIISDRDHAWLSPEDAKTALSWLEVQAMKKGIKIADQNWLKQQFKTRQSELAALQVSGPLTVYAAALRSLIQDFGQWQGLSDQQQRLRQLLSSDNYHRSLKSEQQLRRQEDQLVKTLEPRVVKYMLCDDFADCKRIQQSMNLSRLQIQGSKSDQLNAIMTRRVLVRFHQQLLGYAGKALQQNQIDKAIRALELSTQFYPQGVWSHYNLAMAYCRKNAKKEALKAFRTAIEMGLPNSSASRVPQDLPCLNASQIEQAWQKG